MTRLSPARRGIYEGNLRYFAETEQRGEILSARHREMRDHYRAAIAADEALIAAEEGSLSHPEEAREREMWDEARTLLLCDSGATRETLIRLIGGRNYMIDLIGEKTGLKIERRSGAWFGTPRDSTSEIKADI